MKALNELREYARGHQTMVNHTLLEIADRIEAEYESSYKDGYDEGFASADDWLAQHEDAMAEHGWVKFPPLDADGEPWHIGDEIANQYNLHLTVSEIVYASNGYWMLHAKPNWRFYANIACHYHAPTVEDILREFALRAIRESEGNYGDLDETCAEYAKRLRLVGEDE